MLPRVQDSFLYQSRTLYRPWYSLVEDSFYPITSPVQGRALVAEMAALRRDAAAKAASLAESQERFTAQRMEIAEIKVRPPWGAILLTKPVVDQGVGVRCKTPVPKAWV